MIHEGYRPFQPQGVQIPLEKVGVRGSERRPGERRLSIVRPPEPEQPKTLLQEMQQYMTRRQSLRDHGYFFLMGKESANVNLADATHNDLYAIGLDTSLPDWRSVMTKGNHKRVENVFDSYAIGRMSPEQQREVLAKWERLHELDRNDPNPMRVIPLAPAETETVTWLLARIGVQFDAPPERFKESEASLLFRMRSTTADHQPQWEQEQKTPGDRYRASRRG